MTMPMFAERVFSAESAGPRVALVAAWCLLLAIRAVPAAAQTTGPRADSVSPSSGVGTSQRFELRYSDDAGATALAQGWVWFNETFASTSAMSCLAYYDRRSNRLSVIDDTATTWQGATLGAGTTLQNSRCSIDAGSTTVTLSGNTLILSLPVTFDPRTPATRNIYMYAASATGVSGWQTRGTWTVPPPVVTADAVVPSAGTGTSQTFELRYSHGSGAAALSRVWVWLNETFATTSELSCLAYYDRPTHSVSLLEDIGTVWQTAALGGATTTLQNSRCSINIAATAVTLSGNTLILSLPFMFDPRAHGTRNLYMFAAGEGGTSGWQARGTWTVPAGASAVTADRVTPDVGEGARGSFTLEFSDTSGAENLAQTWVWFIDRFAAVSVSSCLAYYERSSNRVYLLNDAGTTWRSATVGQSGALQNSQCAIVMNGAGASLNGDSLTLTLPVVFAPNYGGAKNVYMYALGGSALNSGWVRRGTWTAPTTGLSLTADRPSPQFAGVSTTWTAAADGASSEYKFWQWDGAAWTVVRDWGGSDTFIWTPPGPGDYRVAVWVRTNGSALDEPQRYTSAAFRIRPKVTDARLILNPVSTQIVGKAVTLSATASGGLAPYEYQFRVQDLTGRWTVVRDWGSVASVAWVPSAIGTYTVGLYARSSGASMGAYEAADFRSFAVAANCTPNTTDGPLYVPESGGNSSIWIDVHPTCPWTGQIATTWLEFASSGSGYGPGAVTVRATGNGEATRSSRVSFGNRSVEIVQQGFDSGTCTWSIDDRGKTFDWNNHESSVFVNAPSDCQWRVTVGGDFIDVAGAEQRTGPGTVFFSVENNTTTTLRRGVLRLDGRLMMVTQYGVGGGQDPPGCSYSVTPSEPLVGPGNGQYRVWVATGSGCAWTAQTGGWLHALDGASRSGPGWLTYAVENNTAADGRVGVMTVAGRTITVTQRPVDGCGYAVDPPHLQVSSGNHLGAISVFANPGCLWSAARTGAFLSLTDAVSGTGAGVVAYSVENNTTMVPRAGEVRVAGISIAVSQMAVGDCAYQVSPLEESIESGNVTGSVHVSTRSDCQWSAASETAFLAVTGAGSTRTGSGEVVYTAENNTSPEGRTGVLQVAGTRVVVTQPGANNCTFALAPSSRHVLPGGETFTVTVSTQAGCPWQASTTTPSVIQLWGDLTQTGPGSVEVEVENHTSLMSRTGLVQVGGQTLTVGQSGVCDPTVQPLERTVNCGAGESVVDVSTGAECVWTAESNAAFLHVLPYSGVGPDSLRFAYDANLTGASRTGTLTVAGQIVTVTQVAATDPAGEFDPSRDVVRFYHTDAIGSVRMITDANGAQVGERLDYLPFGEPWPASASSAEIRRFAGKEHDSQTGLDYFGARYYAGGNGRFTTVDPVLPVDDALLDPQRWNRYSYVMHRPLALTDPDGRCPQCWLLVQRLVQQAAQLGSRYGTQAYNWASRFFNSPTGQEVTTVAAEAITGGQLPHGFSSAAQLQNFGKTLNIGLTEAVSGGARAFLTGSAVTGASFRTGAAFDLGRTSDLDVALVARDLVTKAKELGLTLRGRGSRTGPLRAEDLKALGLEKLAQRLSQMAGRPVNFMLYESEEALRGRGVGYLPF